MRWVIYPNCDAIPGQGGLNWGCLHPRCVVIRVLETGVAQLVKDRYANQHQLKATR